MNGSAKEVQPALQAPEDERYSSLEFINDYRLLVSL